MFCPKPSLTVFSISLSQHSADMTPSGDNEMLTVIVYCQADEKISALPGEFSIRYGGSGGEGEERGESPPVSRKDSCDTAVIIMSD